MKKPPGSENHTDRFRRHWISPCYRERRRHPMGVDLARRGVRVQNHVPGPYRRPVRLAVPAGHEIALKARLALLRDCP